MAESCLTSVDTMVQGIRVCRKAMENFQMAYPFQKSAVMGYIMVTNQITYWPSKDVGLYWIKNLSLLSERLQEVWVSGAYKVLSSTGSTMYNVILPSSRSNRTAWSSQGLTKNRRPRNNFKASTLHWEGGTSCFATTSPRVGANCLAVMCLAAIYCYNWLTRYNSSPINS